MQPWHEAASLIPSAAAQFDGVVDKYCVMQLVTEKGKDVVYCRDWGAKYNKTITYKSAFYAGVQACVQHAISKGFTGVITLNPRLDQARSGLNC
jgi:hypothetical protein